MTQPTTKERPIIFGAESINAIKCGGKTQTRRIAKAALPDTPFGTPDAACKTNGDTWIFYYGNESRMSDLDEFTKLAYGPDDGFKCPYGKPGDRLWVREKFAFAGGDESGTGVTPYCWYWADNPVALPDDGRWSSPIHMPRAASRILLEITAVRVERLQGITPDDCHAEGIMHTDHWCNVKGDTLPPIAAKYDCSTQESEGVYMRLAHEAYAREAFRDAWDGVNGHRAPWYDNPWVWVVEFKKVNPLKVIA